MNGETGIVYLLHFDRRYRHARHYIGWCQNGNLPWRLARHRAGDGAKLTRAATQAGIGYEIVREWHNVTRDFERQLHKRRKSAELCPICRAEKRLRKSALVVPAGIAKQLPDDLPPGTVVQCW